MRSLKVYTESGIDVTSVVGDVGYGFANWGADGKSWYHNGGDNGYAVIANSNGENFSDVGMNVGHGWSQTYERVFSYELYDDGAIVLSGNVTFISGYLGFSGGGFDEIRLMASIVTPSCIGDGTYQALAMDSIETATSEVPEPSTLLLLGSGIAGVGYLRRRLRK